MATGGDFLFPVGGLIDTDQHSTSIWQVSTGDTLSRRRQLIRLYTPEDMATCIATWRLLDRVSCKALQGSHDINARLKMRCVMRASFVPFYCCINRAAREHTAPVAALLFSVCAFCLDNEKNI